MNESELQKEISEIDKRLNDIEQEELLSNNSKNNEWEQQYKEFEQTGETISLIAEKDKKIAEWLNMLSNNNELNWQQKSRAISSSLFNILDKLIKQNPTPHLSLEKQYSLINKSGKYINANCKKELSNLVLELKRLSVAPIGEIYASASDTNNSVNYDKNEINNNFNESKATDLNIKDFEKLVLEKVNDDQISQLYQSCVINKTCSRNDLIKIIDNFYSNRDNLSDDDMIKLYLKVLNNLEGKLLKYECIEDLRFVTFCRRDFLKEELTKSLLKKDFNQAFYDIVDYVKADTWISFGSVPNKYDFKKIDNDDCDYKKCGIICMQEKEIILNMIQEFKNSLAGGKLTFDDRDNSIAAAVDKLRLIPTGSEFKINQIIDNFEDIDDFNNKFDIYNKVIEESKKQGIYFESTNTGVTGMPWANSFIKK